MLTDEMGPTAVLCDIKFVSLVKQLGCFQLVYSYHFGHLITVPTCDMNPDPHEISVGRTQCSCRTEE